MVCQAAEWVWGLSSVRKFLNGRNAGLFRPISKISKIFLESFLTVDWILGLKNNNPVPQSGNLSHF
jgi:hypothetical protein